jgi:hypothetical protein
MLRVLVPLLAMLAALGCCACGAEPGGRTIFADEDTGAPPDAMAPDARDARDASDAGDSLDARDARDALDEAESLASDAAETGPLAPTCVLPAKLGAPTALASLSTDDTELFGAVTPDERTIVWVRVDDGGETELRIADRADAKVAFTPSPSITQPTGGIAAGKVALSPDGLRVLYVSADGRTLREYARPTRGGDFSWQAQDEPFGAINRLVADAPGNAVSDLVLGFDDRTLYFVLTEAAGSSIRRATRASAGASWSAGVPLLEPELQAQAGGLVRPTGASADGLTLFVWSDVTSTAYAALRGGTGEPFEKLQPLGARRLLGVNADCSTLYFSAPTARADLDLVYVR